MHSCIRLDRTSHSVVINDRIVRASLNGPSTSPKVLGQAILEIHDVGPVRALLSWLSNINPVYAITYLHAERFVYKMGANGYPNVSYVLFPLDKKPSCQHYWSKARFVNKAFQRTNKAKLLTNSQTCWLLLWRTDCIRWIVTQLGNLNMTVENKLTSYL